MCQEKRTGICNFCPFDQKCQEERTIQYHAFYYWNFDITPPTEYVNKVAQFIHDHPTLFKSAGPQ